MACHCLKLKNATEFYGLLKSRDQDLVLKMVKCVLSAYKRDKDIIDIFDIEFDNNDGLVFSIDKSQYSEMLGSCLDDLIKMEEYELCTDIKKILDKKPRKKKELNMG